MANLTRQLVQLSFDKIDFPYKEIEMDGELRDHVHEYPHSPGGAPEKLGRRLYVFNITSSFHGDFVPEKYRDLWPWNLAKLVSLFEKGETKDLVLPQIGSPIRAYCTNWKRVLKHNVTSGEAVTLKFREDSERLRLVEEALKIKAVSYAKALSATDAEIRKLPSNKRGLFDTLMQGASQILAYKDQFDLYSNLLEAKCLAVIGMARQFIETAQVLSDPLNYLLLDALHSLLSETIKVYKDQQQTGITTSRYTVTRVSTLSEVAIAIYGVSGKSSELMALNSIPNPLQIPVGTVLRYYKD